MQLTIILSHKKIRASSSLYKRERVKLITPAFLGLNYVDVIVCGDLKQIKIYLI